MNQHLHSILQLIQQSDTLTSEQKAAILKSLKDADKELEITAFKLDRTEKVKRTTAILLEETIEELEQKRKAVEVQNRELEIESSLERVRTAAMGMKKPDDLLLICEIVFAELKSLGFNEIRNALIHTFNDENDYFLDYDFSDYTGGRISRIPIKGIFTVEKFLKGIGQSSDSFVEMKVEGAELEDWKKQRKDTGQLEDNRIEAVQSLFYYYYSIGVGALGISTFASVSTEKREVLKRFRNVFDFAYRRYMDVAQAEEQAREAKIEASLEKVRGQAMAMHNSRDLSSTASIVFAELRKLGIKSLRFGVGILAKDSRKVQLYSATSSPEGEHLALLGWVNLSGHPTLESLYEHIIKNEDYFPVLTGELLKSYYETILPGFVVPVPDWYYSQKQYGHFLIISVGGLYAWSDQPYTDPEIKILKRFAAIIDLTFRRYFELQQSEANAQEAIKQSSLDRVRAEIASMRTVDDLNDITPIIWRELTTLGVPFFRCGVFIISEEEQLVHVYLSTPDGKSLAVLHLSFEGAEITSNSVKHWRQQKIYVEHWNREQFIAWVQSLKGQGQVQSAQTYQAGQEPPESLTLQFIPFAQGMLYIGSTDPLNEDQLQLVKELSNAFSVAFARYEDFKKLEDAKSKIETTLVDLKAAQAQLIQSEKMASLGELTAGIAHEIQNPLNFVNNFSEVNAELIDEVKQALNSGNSNEALKLTDDIKQNLEKINLHGKRADGIVKSMLQHSRSSEQSGKLKKEPTDINSLADEYFRLAYHGLRAKDQTFNATLKTDFDPTLSAGLSGTGLIQVIPQDIARAILNLITNAFYAVNEKAKKLRGSGQSFTPVVSVTTKNRGDKIEIRVKDNGPGIPQHALDKIFQPFFTTKPTGQGTGLGLSLAYDIVKAHRGELKVITEPGIGSEFIIQLPSERLPEP